MRLLDQATQPAPALRGEGRLRSGGTRPGGPGAAGLRRWEPRQIVSCAPLMRIGAAGYALDLAGGQAEHLPQLAKRPSDSLFVIGSIWESPTR